MADQDYNFLSADPVRPISDTISKWQGVQKNALDIQQAQAQVEQGKALQSAIDPQTGQFDQSKYMQILAGNPLAARGALAAAQGGVTLDTNTYDLHSKRLDAANSAMAQLIADNPGGVPGDAMHAAIERQRALGNLTDQEAQAEHAQVNSDPKANTQLLLQGLGHGMAVKTALDAVKPPTQTVTVPQGVIPITPQPQSSSSQGGGVTQGTGGVVSGVAPGETQEYTFTPVDANGKPTGTPYKVTAPKGTVFPSMQGTQITPAAPAASGSTGAGGSTGGGGGSTFPPGYTGRGVPPPPNPALANPANAKPATPTPATPATPTPTPAPTSQPPGGGVATSVPLGRAEAIQQDVKQFKDDQANLPNWQTTDQNLGHAIEALKLTTSGRSTESTHNLYSFLMAQGALPPGMEDNVKNYDLFKKYTERIIADLGNAAGTDQGRQLAAMSNAGTSFSTAANMEIMRNDIAKNRQKMAAYMLEDPNGSGDGYTARRAAVSSNTDPRGFVWSLYTPTEQAKILQEVSKDKTADAKLHRAIGIADALHISTTPGQTPAGPAVRPTPPTPSPAPGPRADIGPNPLAPTTNYAAVTPNALAA